MIKKQRYLTLLVASAGLLVMSGVLSGCERRDLYVYGSEFHSLTLAVDWSEYQTKAPDGMTVWFWPVEGDADAPVQTREPYRFTTSSVRSYDLYLQTGRYRGVVIDYSPEEYGSQQFVDMDQLASARVEALRESHQPQPTDGGAQELYGVTAYWHELPQEETGLVRVMSQPEMMALDTLSDMHVRAGEYGDYIPYDDRADYQQQMQVTTFQATPKPLVWQLYLRIFVKGINNLTRVESTVAGLADGHLLALDRNTDVACLVEATDWHIVKTDNSGNGYIETTLNTFGLRPSAVDESAAARRHGASGEQYVVQDAGEVRLNLRFVLRDGSTVVYCHYDVGSHLRQITDEQLLVLRLDESDFGGDGTGGTLGPGPDLPYVEPHDGTGFGADVTPWDDGGEADATF